MIYTTLLLKVFFLHFDFVDKAGNPAQTKCVAHVDSYNPRSMNKHLTDDAEI